MKHPAPQVSLRQQNDRLYRTSLTVTIITVLTIISIIASYFYLEDLDTQGRDVLLGVNELAISIQKSPDTASGQTVAAWNALMHQLGRVSFFLGYKTSLEQPAYATADQGLAYRENLREFAARVRFNQSKVRQWNQLINLGLLLVSLGGIITLFLAARSSRRSSRSLMAEIDRGMETLHDLLQFKPAAMAAPRSSGIVELSEFFSHLGRVSSLIDLDHTLGKLSGYGNINLLVENLAATIRQFMPCERVALAFMTSNNMVTAETAWATYPDIVLVPGYSEHIDRTSLRALVETQNPRIINDLAAYAKRQATSAATRLLVQEGVHASITVPLMYQDKCVGFLFVSTRQQLDYQAEHARELMRISSALRQKLYMEYLFQETIAESSRAFVTLMSEKDNETSLHITRMAHYSYILARTYNLHVARLEPSQMREILWFSPLHDIGKIGIPDRILHKPGPLDEAERELMQTHVAIGERVISTMNSRLEHMLSHSMLQTAVHIISTHHEKFDGTGYPRGLAGTAIPVSGRIVAVADVFDALTSRRPYKPAYGIRKALDIMNNLMPGHFDPAILECLDRSLNEIQQVYDEFKEV